MEIDEEDGESTVDQDQGTRRENNRQQNLKHGRGDEYSHIYNHHGYQ